MVKKKRQFISVYFDDGLVNDRKKRDVTVAFHLSDPIYNRCKELGSSGIKDAIGIYSFSELAKEARKEDRSISNYIKHRLRVHLKHEKHTTC